MVTVRLRTAATALLALIAFVGCTGEPTTGTDSTSQPEADPPSTDESAAPEREMERMVFDLVNAERKERGLDALSWDDQLADLARQWSQHMADSGTLQHQDIDRMLERSTGFTGVGENIYHATAPVPASTTHVGWMRSSGHRANVLREDFDRLGVGFVCTDDGEVWATQRFGATDPSAGAGDDDVPPREPIVADEGEGPTCPTGADVVG